MKGGNVVQAKSYAFAVRIVRLYQHLSTKLCRLLASIQKSTKQPAAPVRNS